jgi:translation initiation factor 3 subunit E
MLKVIEFLEADKVYVDKKNPMECASEVVQAKLDLLNTTGCVDYAIKVHKQLHPKEAEPAEMGQRKMEILKKMKKLEGECAPLVELSKNADLVRQLRMEKLFHIGYLKENHQIEPEMVDALCAFAKCRFDAGQYEAAAELLGIFRLLCTNQEKAFSALWGKLAAEILMQNWEVAMEDLTKLREAIESKACPPLEQLQQRSWLLHWALFVFFSCPNTEGSQWHCGPVL